MSNKVLRHPEKEEIISMLTSGESLKTVEKWLKKKYPRTRRFRISYITLQKFRKEYLNIKGDVLAEIQEARKTTVAENAKDCIRHKVLTSDAYKKKLSEVVNTEIDVTRKIIEMEALISSRLEFYFNTLEAGGGKDDEKMFLEILNTQRALMADWKKYVERVADKTIEHNVNINIVNEQVSVLKGVVFEVLLELDPLLVPVFIEKVHSRLENTGYLNDRYLKQIEVVDGKII